MRLYEMTESGWSMCGCGNTPEDEGFDTVTREGEHVEPTADGSWEGFVKCERCGNIAHQDETIRAGDHAFIRRDCPLVDDSGYVHVSYIGDGEVELVDDRGEVKLKVNLADKTHREELERNVVITSTTYQRSLVHEINKRLPDDLRVERWHSGGGIELLVIRKQLKDKRIVEVQVGPGIPMSITEAMDSVDLMIGSELLTVDEDWLDEGPEGGYFHKLFGDDRAKYQPEVLGQFIADKTTEIINEVS